jgi:hypothetical protein
MTNFLKIAGTAGISVLALGTAITASHADTIDSAAEGQAVVTKLGAGTSAITYWVNEAGGRRVVTTVDTVTARDGGADNHTIVRFSSLLQPGQSQLISVPVAVGAQQQALRIHRAGDRIEMARLSR